MMTGEADLQSKLHYEELALRYWRSRIEECKRGGKWALVGNIAYYREQEREVSKKITHIMQEINDLEVSK